MQKRLRMTCLVLTLILALIPLLPLPKGTSADQTSDMLTIDGLVNRPLNFTYTELLSFPMVSEVAELKCVAGSPDVTANWTGIPLFYLLTMAQISSEAYKIATYGSDMYSSDLTVEDALKPTTILALRANGLTSAGGIQPIARVVFSTLFPRLIVPYNWGYKWVAQVDEIKVVNSDYKGTYESSGYPDDAVRPDTTITSSITPPIQELNFASGNLTFKAEAFTNASIDAYALDYSKKEISLSMTVPSGTGGFADFSLPQDFLKGPYNVTVDNMPVGVIEADLTNQSYVYAFFPEGSHAVKIIGAGIFGFAPEIEVSFSRIINVGETAIFNASKSATYGTIVSYEWNFGDGVNGTGAVVSHSFSKVGTFQVELNVTDNDGLSSAETLTITVENPLDYTLAAKVVLATISGLLILMFAVLVRSRRKERAPKQ